jgi:hypothetical protein
MSPGLKYLLAVLEERGLRPAIGSDGKPLLKGSAEEVTPALREMLALYREEIMLHLRESTPLAVAPALPPVRLREWLMQSGRISQESPETAEENQRQNQHCTTALSWRWVGESDWRQVPNRLPARDDHLPRWEG